MPRFFALSMQTPSKSMLNFRPLLVNSQRNTKGLKKALSIYVVLTRLFLSFAKTKGEEKMNLRRNMAKTTSITLVLLIASVALMATSVQAQEHGGTLIDNGSVPLPAGVTADEIYESISHMSFRPNPVGLGQPILVNLWLQPPLHVVRLFGNAFLVTLTKPDGTTDQIGPLSSYLGDATAWFEYTVDQVGTWKIKFDFLGGYFAAGNYTTPGSFQHGAIVNFPKSVYYKPSSDGPYDLVVQNDMVRSWPPSPLPTDYWTRPVSVENREWWPISGWYPSTGIIGGGPNWPANTNTYMSNYLYTPYVQAPKSAHVVWKRQDAISGLIGGPLGQISLGGSGSSPTIVYAGRAYQTVTKNVDGVSTSVWQCYDLRTGEIYWEKTGITQIPNAVTYSERTSETVPGEEASRSGLAVNLLYVGGGRFITYDPWTGNANRNISISPLTTGTYYANGVSFPLFLTVQSVSGGQYRLINWTIVGDISFGGPTNLRLGVLNNVSWPFSSLGTVDYEAGVAVNTASITTPGTGGIGAGFVVAYGQRLIGTSMVTGQVLFNVTTDISTGLEGFFSGSTAVADHGKYAVRLNDGHWHCWDLRTGAELWTSELSSWPWGTFGCYGVQSYGGNIISNQYDGVVAYNWENGKISWWYKYTAPYPYETPYGDSETGDVYMPWFTGTTRIADDIVFTYNTEHSISNPLPRGYKLHAINATTGEGIWNITGSMSPGAIADGYMTAGNSYDGYMYVFGRGKSATTVTAPDVVISKGSGVVIKGTVLDLSPAQPGTPCVSKDSMAIQMEYLHMQHPIDGLDHNIQMTGVPVSLTAIDSNNNVVDIGVVTTSAYYGTFEKAWTPPAEGTYRVIATFAGDESYGSSAAATAVAVGPAPETTQPPETPVIPDYTWTIIGAAIAVIIAVAIAVLILRKR